MTGDEKPEGNDDPRLLSIAKALSDGARIDWSDDEGDDEVLRRMKARLRFVESVADAHRRVLNDITATGAAEETGEGTPPLDPES